MKPDEIERHCENIMKLPGIRNRIVILCEGNILEGRPSPKWFKELEKMPDTSFYKNCIPQSWETKSWPQFFNCGCRDDVLYTYFALLKQWDLNPAQLFAIVDLDIQPHQIGEEDYPFGDTEAIFYNLYNATKVNEKHAHQHRIWVTGLIHKEAYFLLPQVQHLFTQFAEPLWYNQQPLNFDNLYRDMAKAMVSDQDLRDHFSVITKRVQYCKDLATDTPENLSSSWLQQFQHDSKNHELIYALLMIKKAKEYWKKICPQLDDEGIPPERIMANLKKIRDSLMLEIARFYSSQKEPTPDNHIPFFLKTLYDHYCGGQA